MVDLDHAAEVVPESGEGDDAACGRRDRRAGAGREVEAGMKGVGVGEGIERLPNDEVSSAPAIGRRDGRRISSSDCCAAAPASVAI